MIRPPPLTAGTIELATTIFTAPPHLHASRQSRRPLAHTSVRRGAEANCRAQAKLRPSQTAVAGSRPQDRAATSSRRLCPGSPARAAGGLTTVGRTDEHG